MRKKTHYRFLSSKKSRIIALILCVIGGFLGLHYFYVKRHWRGAFNLFLVLALTIASNVYGLHYIRIVWAAGTVIHWREIIAVASAAILGLTWIWDIVQIAKGKFRDSEKLMLK